MERSGDETSEVEQLGIVLMPIYVQQCDSCEIRFESIRRMSQIEENPACPSCSGPTVRVLEPPANRSPVDPVVVYRAPDGSFRFPGATSGPSTEKYERMGYQRIEARGIRETDRVMRDVNRQLSSENARNDERRQAFREQVMASARSELRDRMRTMSELGRDVAREAMRQRDQKQRRRSIDPGVHAEVYSFDRSNRS